MDNEVQTETVVQPAKRKDTRKRKKTFLSNARKYAKKGYFGRGSRLDEDTYQYFIRIMEAYKEGFPTEEDKLLFVNNVFTQTENDEITNCCNQVGCRVVETLLPFANNSVLKRYMTVIGEDLRPLCCDRFASHVIESLVTIACTKSLETIEETNVEELEFRKECRQFTIKISKFMLNNMEDYVWDTYGNHIIRSVLVNLAQIPKEVVESKNGKEVEKVVVEIEPQNIPEEFVEILTDYAQRLIVWPQFKDFPESEITSGLLQILIRAITKFSYKLQKKYINKLLDDCFSDGLDETKDNSNVLPKVFLSKSAMMLLEGCIQSAPEKLFTKIYAKLFLGRLVKLASLRSTNYSVQKLLGNCKQKEEFESIFDELSDNLKDIITEGHTGIIWILAQTCKRLGAKQGHFVQSLMKALDCLDPAERQNLFVLCLSKFCTFADQCKSNTDTLDKEKLHIHGTLIVQIVLEFNKPIKLVNSVINLELKQLRGLFTNPKGCHIMDSYMKSQYVGEKSREKLILKLQGSYQDLVCSRFGSRSFDAIWNVANPKCRSAIMDELAYKEGGWSHTEFGKHIAHKVNITLYKRSKDDWKISMGKTDFKNTDVLQKE